MTPLFISTINLSEAEQKVFQVALRSVKDENLQCELLPNQDGRGHLVVIDLEAEQSASIFKSLRPGQVKLVLSSEHKTGTNLVSVLKPIREDSFKDVLLKVCHKMTEQLSQADASPASDDTNTPEPDLHETSTPEPIAPEPQTHRADLADFMQKVIQVRENKQYCVITLEGMSDIVVDGEREMLLSHDSFESIIEAELETFEHAGIKILPNKQNYNNSGYATITALSGFLWELAVKTSGSILPPGLDDETKVSLKAWPNFTRHGYRPEHLKIAALLAKQSISINVITEKTALEKTLVQQFVNGCYAVGLLALNRQTERAHATKQVSPEKQTIFKRLAYKLGFA